MDTPENLAHISESYQGRLLEYGHDPRDVEAISEGWRYAPLPHQPDEQIPYVRLGEYNEGQAPVLYVPGFTEGIEAKAPFGAEMATKGFDIIIPGQNRVGILEDTSGRKDATHS